MLTGMIATPMSYNPSEAVSSSSLSSAMSGRGRPSRELPATCGYVVLSVFALRLAHDSLFDELRERRVLFD